MTMPKKGARHIVVDGLEYRWRIRRKGTIGQTDYGVGHIHVSIELAQTPGTTLLIVTDIPHPAGYGFESVIAVHPADIALWIKQAISIGWTPQANCSPFMVRIDGDVFEQTTMFRRSAKVAD